MSEQTKAIIQEFMVRLAAMKFMPKIPFAVVSTVFSVMLLIAFTLGGYLFGKVGELGSTHQEFRIKAVRVHETRKKDIEQNAKSITDVEEDIEDINYKIGQILDLMREQR